MKLLSKLRFVGLSALVSVGLTGCVFTLGDGDGSLDTGGTNTFVPNQPGAQCGLNAVVSQFGECECLAGHTWCDPVLDPGPNGRNNCCVGTVDPTQACATGENNVLLVNNPNDPADDQCTCIAGFTWCDPNDTTNLNCCWDEKNNVPDAGNPGVHPDPAESCDPNTEVRWCSHDQDQGPMGSVAYACIDGKWVDRTSDLDDECRVDGFDFAYGCVHIPGPNGAPGVAETMCGNGPGTACDSSLPDSCSADETQLLFCEYGKVTVQQCAPLNGEACKTANDEEFEFGKCGKQNDRLSCLCFDEDPSATAGDATTDGAGTGGTTDTGTGTGF